MLSFYPGDKFIKDPISIFYIHEGGLGIYGGIIGALLVGGLFAKFRKQNVLAVLDIGVLGFLIGQAIGRWGNFVNQEAFGGPTSLPWGMVSENTLAVSPDSPVHPCFFMNPCGVYWDSSYFIFLLQNSVNTTDKPFYYILSGTEQADFLSKH